MSGLVAKLIEANDRSLIIPDPSGNCHFHADIYNARQLDTCLERLRLKQEFASLVDTDAPAVHELYEETFRHKQYTGRSGTMYGYEGLGCVYWHMVSKLLLAIQENYFWALDRQAPEATLESLGDLYYLVRGGLGPDKTPLEYGAFPTDPYSHTPAHAGAQQPGMTGQVKEAILTRRGELGVRIRDGHLVFQPYLLRRREFLNNSTKWTYFDIHGNRQCVELGPRQLAFTVCQVPVCYRMTDGPWRLCCEFAGGQKTESGEVAVDAQTSNRIFARTGDVVQIQVDLPTRSITRA